MLGWVVVVVDQIGDVGSRVESMVGRLSELLVLVAVSSLSCCPVELFAELLGFGGMGCEGDFGGELSNGAVVVGVVVFGFVGWRWCAGLHWRWCVLAR